jgi:Galactose oxidase, central domain
MRLSPKATVLLAALTALVSCRSEPRHATDAPPGSGRVVSAGSLTVPRAAHTATALPDGSVLIAGGCTEDSCEEGEGSATFEVWKDGTSQTGRLTVPRTGQTATLLPDGKVLLAGGWSGAAVTASTEIADPASRASRPATSLSLARSGHSATPLPDGTVLFAGGTTGREPLDLAEVYDPKTGSFRPVGRLSTPRAGHMAVALRDGRVLLAGGDGPNREILSSAELYDPATGRFTPTGSMTRIRHKHGAAPLPDGRVLIVGGSDEKDFQGRTASAEVFDPALGAFSPADDMAAPRFKLQDAVVALRSGRVFVGGGGRSAELFDLGSGSFRPVEGSLGSGWSFAAAALLPDGSVLVTGGYDERIRVTAGMWRYWPGTQGSG